MHGVFILHTIISSVARNLFRFPFPSSFAKPFRGSTVPAFPAIQCFPFLAVGHAPSYRQRKRSLDFARDDVAEVAFSQHTLYTGRGLSIPPYRHFERSEKSSLHSALSCSFRKRVPLFRAFLFPSQKHSRFLLSHIRRYTGVQERSRASLGMTLRKWRFPNIPFMRDVGYPSPIPSFRAQSRNLPCTLLFLAPFAKGFPFSALSCSLRRSIPVFCYHTYSAILVCKKDPSASLGMTLRKWRFPNISFIRDVGYLFFSPLPSFRAQSRNLPCTLLFLAPFAKGFPFSTVSHTTLYRCARKIPRLRSG